MLTPADEQLLHQAPLPMAWAATSDPRFYDRHWFEGVAPDGETMLIAGVARYSNTGMCDGFVAVQRDQRQHNARFAAPAEGSDPAQAGPLAVQVDVPFERLRIDLSPGAHPISADLRWTSTGPARLERPTVRREAGRLVQDSQRYGQLGRLDGELVLAGRRIEVVEWWAVRDHSWGVRPGVGGVDLPSIAPGEQPEAQVHLWTFVSAGDLSCHVQVIENGEGEVSFLDGVLHDRSGQPARSVVGLDHDIEFVPDTREWSRLRYCLTLSDGSEASLEATALGRAWAYRGTGYGRGFDDGLGLGAVRPPTAEWDMLDLSAPGRVTRDGVPYRPGHREQPARVRLDGRVGTGHVAVMTSGTIPRYGLRRRGR